MSFRITISEMSNTLEKCVESVVCRVDTPNDSNARSSEVGNIIQILGRTGTEEPTVDLYLWSLLPVNDAKAYRSVEVEITGALGQVFRKVTFPNTIVVDYSESYSTYNGEGTFCILLKQKRDKNDTVKVEGDLSSPEDDN